MNYFGTKSAARRYQKGRPFFHSAIVERIRRFLAITEPLDAALDVACGTGLSAVALKNIARNVAGVDASAEMIALAAKEKRIEYFLAPAENLPFEKDEFDLITVSQGFHWLDRDKFLTEAKRVLRPDGWLVVYDDYFSGKMMENPDFYRWFKEYLARYPSPTRAEIKFTPENTKPYGFDLLGEESYENTIEFSPAELVDFLVTQSNVIAAVEGGSEDIEDARDWLMKGIEPIFGGSKREKFLFNAPIWYLHCSK